ncbi:MAG TPA: DUF1275 domain-containing protein [Alphaproteobacteria bacterium]|nr:DUF1275 domain-containing protein [Alphaproteobacteria bacterium]
MFVASIRKLTGKHRTRGANISLGLLLAAIAGAINAGGFLAIGQYTSHMTGMLSAVADYIALNKLYTAFISLGFVFSFILGAASSAIIINWARSRQFHSEFALALMLEAILLLLFGIVASGGMQHDFELSVNLTITLLCYIMGLQNAIITKISNSEIRTTHITGLSTDVGIEIGKIFYFWGSHNKNVKISIYKLALFSGLIFAFLIGGIMGALAFKNFGYITTTPIALLLVIIASVPIFDDLTGRKF